MGREMRCEVRQGDRHFFATALLEAESIILRGDHKLTVPLAQLASVKVSDGALVLEQQGGKVIALELGTREAGLWAKKIANPPSRIDKLGIKAGSKVALVAVTDAAIATELREAGAQLVAAIEAEILLVELSRDEDIDVLQNIVAVMPRTGKLWVLRPRGAAGRLSEEAVMTLGKALGLSISKTLRFNERLTGERLGWPRA